MKFILKGLGVSFFTALCASAEALAAGVAVSDGETVSVAAGCRDSLVKALPATLSRIRRHPDEPSLAVIVRERPGEGGNARRLRCFLI